MDVIFDIDGTLADPSHRLHFIKDTKSWITGKDGLLKPDWDSFLADYMVANDTPIAQTWHIMLGLLQNGHNVIFVTGRKESTRTITEAWLSDPSCDMRRQAISMIRGNVWHPSGIPLYMRADGDRRPSDVVKREGMMRARADGYNPTLVFEDRKSDAEMWRRNGILCCQVAEGDY